MNRKYINAIKVLNEYKDKNTADDSKILFYKGRVALAIKEYELAASYFDSLKILGESGLKEKPKKWIYHDYLYKAYAGLGMKEEFEKEFELLEALVPFESDILVGTDRNIQKIECLIWLKEYDKAIDLIEQMLSKPSLLTISKLKLSPVYDPIRNNTRFESVLRK
jgi:tetratricopeptide (TPR) repeat protein